MESQVASYESKVRFERFEMQAKTVDMRVKTCLEYLKKNDV